MKTTIRIWKIMSALMIWQLNLYSQPVYFNQTIDLEGEWGTGMTVLTSDSSYYIAGITGPGYNLSIIQIGWTGYEDSWIKKYGEVNESWFPGSPGSLYPIDSSGYILGGSIDVDDTSCGTLFRFNHEFDTIYLHRYFSHSDNSLILTTVKPTLDSGYILTGEISIGINNNYTDLILLKTDSLGNELWRRTKNIGGADRGWSLIQLHDSSYIIGGYAYAPGVYHTGNPIVVKFDKNGEFLWSKNAGGPYQDDKAKICLDSDSTFTVLTAVADSVCTNDYDYAKITVIKYRQDGVELWRRHYGESICYNSVSNIRVLDNGDYICCGTQREPGNYDVTRFGWLLRINSEGDSIWFRRYTYSEGNPFRFNYLRDVFPTIDDGFIATGEVYDIPTSPLQRIWVLKVDSLGCDTAGCDPTVGLDDWQIGGLEDLERLDLVLWPNPCSSVVSISLTSRQSLVLSGAKDLCRQSIESWSIEIYDIFGRKVSGTTFSPLLEGRGRGWGTAWTVDEGGWMMDVSSLPAGLYLLVVKDGGKVKASAKFVVAR